MAAGRRVKELKGPQRGGGGERRLLDEKHPRVFWVFFLVSPESGPLLRKRDSVEKTLMLGKI